MPRNVPWSGGLSLTLYGLNLGVDLSMPAASIGSAACAATLYPSTGEVVCATASAAGQL